MSCKYSTLNYDGNLIKITLKKLSFHDCKALNVVKLWSWIEVDSKLIISLKVGNHSKYKIIRIIEMIVENTWNKW